MHLQWISLPTNPKRSAPLSIACLQNWLPLFYRHGVGHSPFPFL